MAAPNTVILKSSAFVTNFARGRNDDSVGTSYQLMWFATKMCGLPSVARSRLCTVILTPVAARTIRDHQRGRKSYGAPALSSMRSNAAMTHALPMVIVAIVAETARLSVASSDTRIISPRSEGSRTVLRLPVHEARSGPRQLLLLPCLSRSALYR